MFGKNYRKKKIITCNEGWQCCWHRCLHGPPVLHIGLRYDKAESCQRQIFRWLRLPLFYPANVRNSSPGALKVCRLFDEETQDKDQECQESDPPQHLLCQSHLEWFSKSQVLMVPDEWLLSHQRESLHDGGMLHVCMGIPANSVRTKILTKLGNISINV